MGSKSYYVIPTQSFDTLEIEAEKVEPHKLYDQTKKYFVLLTPGGELEYRREALDFYGYKAGIDYYELEQNHFLWIGESKLFGLR